jgi:hypothetical protein
MPPQFFDDGSAEAPRRGGSAQNAGIEMKDLHDVTPRDVDLKTKLALGVNLTSGINQYSLFYV